MTNGEFQKKTNFVYTIKYNVQTDRQAGYVVNLTRSVDGLEDEAFYRFDDLQNAFCYSQALNNSFGNGGGLFCTFQPRDIIMHCGQLDEDWRSEGNTPKTLVTKPGLQPNSNILVLNPDHYVNTKGENVPVEDCNFVWLPDYPASPSMELAHYINTDTKLEPLRQFVLKAEEVCANNIGPTLLAISCMYLQCHFKKLMDLVGHYNIPLLYSPHTQVGKTLAASCASNLIGAQNLYSRCTLAYLTGRVTGSTLPFVWDDPTSPNDVVQLAVDLGNGASRGAGPPKTKRGKDNPPTTGCIVTANFSLCNIDRAGTRTVPLMFSPLNKDKQPGEGLELQEMAKEASCAFPLIVGLFEQIKKDTVASQTTLVKKLLPMLDLRLQEGLALPLLYLRLILNELKLYRVMPAVISYIQNQLFQELSGRPTTDQDESTLNTLITRISTIVHNKDLAEEASDHIRDLLTNNVVKKLEEALKVGQVEEEEAEVVEDIPSDDELVFDRERPADRPAILEETDDEEEQQQQDPQPQPHQPQQPEPHVPEEPLPEITQKGQQKRKKLTLLPLVVKKKAITNSQRSSSRSSKGVTSKLTDYYI
ncbi:unnamed protein product [Mytilus edulis]|uniref:Uncharacterized protein n=1 Tax=Mytilus edulis TaxID=6550 RepID=A0A8S3TMW2_MYTED|nr:unnamed protein product [Mytilus edulis]